MAVNPGNKADPNYTSAGSKVAGLSSPWSGTTDRGTDDATNLAGQYPPSPDWGNAIFGGQLPTGTGAPGSAGARYTSATDPTNEPGQTQDTFTGVPDSQIGGTGATGAPGTATTPDGATGGSPILYTNPGSYLAGSFQSERFNDHFSGPQDSTQANDEGYSTGGPQLPGLKGNEPTPLSGRYQTGPNNGSGHVMRGGRDVHP